MRHGLGTVFRMRSPPGPAPCEGARAGVFWAQPLHAGEQFLIDHDLQIPDPWPMLPFATEFPVSSRPDRAAFVAEVVAWLRGTTYSTVLAAASEAVLDTENASLRAPTGEELRLRELKRGDDWLAVGFRHDNPDDQGRVWRTEGVLRRAAVEGDQHLIRLRTQCIARSPGAHLETPRKPYLVKSLLKSEWGGVDAGLAVSDQPIWLEDSDDALAKARAVTLGEATKWLPTVYISATGKGAWILNGREIEKLAYDLGGIAHVVVEPDRAFSFHLRDVTDGKNAYGGTVGLAVPGQGVVRRLFLGWQIQDVQELAAAVRLAATSLRGQMPALGWDWTELQEQALRAQRERDRSRLSAADIEKLYLEEIGNLQDRIAQLEQQLSSHRISDAAGTDEGEFSVGNLARVLGPEVYSGEISDRLRFAAKTTLSVSDQIGLDARSKVILRRFVDRLPASLALSELMGDLARATKDPKRVAGELTSLLSRHGYREKSDNKHIRLEATDGYGGLDAITLPKTPSESRGLKNLCKQIERTLGINKLAD